ncbi:MAG: endonuclease [Amphritea sp.]|nr:endonuclease [Amphritea sp.]
MSLRVSVALCVWLLSACVVADSGPSFSKSKRLLAKMYQEHPVSFYCGCDYKTAGKKLVPDWNSCGYTPRKNANRAGRIEWEHVVPAWAFGHQLQCWQEGGRKACKRIDGFKRMESDLHNLVPAIGEVNGDRSNYSFAQLEGEPRVYGRCDMEVNFKGRKVEPPSNRQGDIARTYFYMRQQYGLRISSKQEKLFTVWNARDPVDSWELKRNELITALQGNSNPYITSPLNGANEITKVNNENAIAPKGVDMDSLMQHVLTKLREL